MIDDVNAVYENGKLLARAMEFPMISRDYFDCSVWEKEFSLLMNNKYNSASSTLIIPNVGVSLYKSIGFFVNSDLVNCHHIAKSDSGSYGNIADNDFSANRADFKTINELAEYIRTTKSRALNEVNFSGNIDAVMGLFIVNSANEKVHYNNIIGIYVIQKFLEKITEIEYPIYLYDRNKGMIEKLEITKEMESYIKEEIATKSILYWPDDLDKPIIENIVNLSHKVL